MHYKHEVAGSKPAFRQKNGGSSEEERVKNENSNHI
jgi:hypothetical protein